MSHKITVTPEIKDGAALRRACRRLGIKYDELKQQYAVEAMREASRKLGFKLRASKAASVKPAPLRFRDLPIGARFTAKALPGVFTKTGRIRGESAGQSFAFRESEAVTRQ